MPKILILFHSWTGNVHRLAEGVAEVESTALGMQKANAR